MIQRENGKIYTPNIFYCKKQKAHNSLYVHIYKMLTTDRQMQNTFSCSLLQNLRDLKGPYINCRTGPYRSASIVNTEQCCSGTSYPFLQKRVQILPHIQIQLSCHQHTFVLYNMHYDRLGIKF